MVKVISFFKKLLGIKKYLQYAILGANAIHRINQDLQTVNNGGKLTLIDEDEDNVPDIIDRKIEKK